jgi:hypothetical protein
MESDAEIRAFLDQQDAWTRDTVRRCGWAIEYVHGEGERDPPFAYTVGLFGLGYPELVVFGMDPGDSAGVLNDVGGRVRDGERVIPGELLSFTNWPHRLHVLPLVNPAEVLFAANRFYRRPDHDPVPALQLVWDDREGRFPWEPDFAAPRWLQPLPGTFRA